MISLEVSDGTIPVQVIVLEFTSMVPLSLKVLEVVIIVDALLPTVT